MKKILSDYERAGTVETCLFNSIYAGHINGQKEMMIRHSNGIKII